jgi:hypothetical protein
MIDTIRCLIPLTQSQHKKAIAFVADSDKWHWAMHNPKTGDLILRHYAGSLPSNFDSHHREVRFSVDPNWNADKTFLTVELSLPKFWYGHNISLLYNWRNALELLRSRFNESFRLNTKAVICDVHNWILNRVDICYAWRFPSQDTAQSFLDSLKVLKYPRKSPIIYPTSILYKGTTYSMKFYLKYPEFRKHDLQSMIKKGASLEWVEHLEHCASGVLRAEATCRTKFLRRQGIETVSDLLKVHRSLEIEGFEPQSEGELHAAISVATAKALPRNADNFVDLSGETPLPNGTIATVEQDWFCELGTVCYFGPPFTLVCHAVEAPTKLMQQLLENFVGDAPGMRAGDKVRQTLLEHYKPQKAARLTAFWLYCRQFGMENAKQTFGHNSYYVSLRDLKKAGVGLIDTPRSKVVELDQNFLENFRLVVPSPYATNQFDDFRDSQNLLNLPQAQ